MPPNTSNNSGTGDPSVLRGSESAAGDWNWDTENHSSHSLYRYSESIWWKLLLLISAPPHFKMTPLPLALRLLITGLSSGYLDDDMSEDSQSHQPQAVRMLGGHQPPPCTCQHYHQPSWSNVLHTCARAHPTLCQHEGLFYVSGRPTDRCPNCYAALPPPQDPPPPSWPLTTPVQKAPCPDSHSRSSYGHSQPRTATPTPRSRSSSTSVYPSTPRQCYDRREVTVCHSKGKELMTGSAKPRLYWGYRDPRYPEVKGPTCWEPDRYGPY